MGLNPIFINELLHVINMSRILKIPIIINKNNGQVNSYFKQGQLPKKVLNAIREQDSSIKKLLIEFRGFE